MQELNIRGYQRNILSIVIDAMCRVYADGMITINYC